MHGHPRRLAASLLFSSTAALVLLTALSPRIASAQATLETCPGGGFGTRLNALFSNPGLLRSPRDDGSYRIPTATVQDIFGDDGVPFSADGTEVYVNVNGNVSFGAPVYRYTPDAIPGLETAAVAGFFADIDLRDHNRLILPDIPNPGSVYLCVVSDGDEDTLTAGDRVMVTWEDVVRYDSDDGFNASQLNSFQVILSVPAATCGTTLAAAGLDIEFRYAELTWTTGDASGGSGGFGGTPATAGLDDGDGNAIALPGSGTADVLRLTEQSNVGIDGVFRIRAWGGTLADCGNGSLDACEICDGTDLSADATCPEGYTGTPLCNNDPANASGDGTCTLDPTPDGCVDVDECATGADDCAAGATCMNAPGGFTCTCGAGTTGDGRTCTALVVTSPTDGAAIGEATPTITGTAEPGAEIIIEIDGVEVGRVVAGSDGAFSFTPDMALTEGEHTLEVTAVGAGGSTATETVGFTVDLTSEIAITEPADDAVTGDSTPRIAGTAEPGAEVEIEVDGTVVATVTADGDGNWEHTLADPLSDGSHTVTATATDAVGNEGSDSVTFTVDSTLPELDLVEPAPGDVTNDATPAISGTATPGAVVEVSVDGTVVGTATADDTGAWSFELGAELVDGEHTVSVSTTSTGGTVSDEATFTVDTMGPALEVVTPAEGSTSSDRTPTFSGTGEPGAEIEIRVDGELIGTTTVGDDGTWSFTPTDDLGDGDHTAEVTATDAAGNTTTETRDFTTDPDAPAEGEVEILSPTAGSSLTVDPPTIVGTAAPGATIEIRIDGALVATVTADAEGNWSHTPAAALGDGEHVIEVRATAPSGAMSMDSVTFEIDVDGPGTGDMDGDGVPDEVECPEGTDPCPDTDGDGDPDVRDGDDDGDGIPTRTERPDGMDRDTDGDGTPDYLDDDDDDDGILTRDEAPGGVPRDTDGDGRPDHRDADDDGDTVPTREERPDGEDVDTDMDGVPDHLDDDDDGDGIPTATERMDGDAHGDDVDADGLPNWLDTDSDGDGAGDMEEGRDDDDGDGVPNYLDPPGNDGTLGGLTGGAGCAVGQGSAGAAWPLALLALLGLVIVRRRDGGAR